MIKLIAVKKISAKLPIGAAFELPERQARMLVAAGVARAADDDPTTRPRRTYRRRDLRAED